MKKPLSVLLTAVLALHPSLALARGEPPEKVQAPRPPLTQAQPPAPEPQKVEKALAAELKKGGFTVGPDGSMTHPETGAKFKPEVLSDLGLEWTKDGRLVFKSTKDAIASEQLMPLLKGMLGFSAVAQRDPADVGRRLQELGVPVSYNNVHLVNPDGTATYFGQMLYHGLTQGPEGDKLTADALSKRLSGERLSQSLALFDSGFNEAFRSKRPDVGLADIKQGFDLLSRPRAATETAFELRPGGDIAGQVAGYKAALEKAKASGDAAEVARLEEARRHLETLSAYRYHSSHDLSKLSPDRRPVPDPGVVPGVPGLLAPLLGRMRMGDPEAPPARSLPTLLGLIDKLPGPPMTTAQKEAFIKSFPMGETVWRMGAHELWKRGLQGEGVKVAVIDTGVAPHPELATAVASRRNFTRQLDGEALGAHGTHVAGTIHALAPKAELRSYAVFDPSFMGGSSAVNLRGGETNDAILKAIDKAVADGNVVINMSLGGGGRPSDDMARKINEYSAKGVIFVVSAGNAGPFVGEVSSPSSALSAWTVGATDSQDRVTSFTSFGRNFDPETMSYVVKPVLLAPGDDMNSAVKPLFGTDGGWSYGRMSGTSMAAPHISGATALMVDAARRMNGLANPVEMSRRIMDSFVATGREANRRELAPDAPAEQRFIYVDPAAAYDRLQASQSLARPKK